MSPVAGADPNPRGHVPANPPPNKKKRDIGAPPLKKYLAGDSTYQNQLSQLQLGMDQFHAANKRSRHQVGQDFRDTRGDMRFQKKQDMGDMAEDFAARGLMNSGVYAQDRGQYAEEFQRSLSDLIRDKKRNIGDLFTSLSQFRDQTKQERKNAQLEAVRRRAIRYGITPR